MLITQEVEISLNGKNIKHYEDLGYTIPRYKDSRYCMVVKRGTKIIVKVEDLEKGSHVLVKVKCDCEDCKDPYLKPMNWKTYLYCVKEGGEYYCNLCSLKLYGQENARSTRLKNGKSFKQWCIDSSREDILFRWDYELNKYKPDEINYGTKVKYWFKCPRGIHDSELQNISEVIHDGNCNCRKCNSFAQWGINNICEDFLEKYWDYDKNIINPWEISYCSSKSIWIKCQEKEYHSSYILRCNSFVKGNRCSYCSSKKVHRLDSLGQYIINNYGECFFNKIWSDKNEKSPYEYSPNSGAKAWWKCLDKEHEDYLRVIDNSNIYNFRCPKCQFSKGEKRIEGQLIKNNFVVNIDYLSQQPFDGLLGLSGGNLTYDFYLLQYNLLIEYQGEQHEKYIKGFHKSKMDFEKQQEHDKRKKEYAESHNIKLLEIWYWDFDNIESILNKELQ